MPFQLPVTIENKEITEQKSTIYHPQVTGLANATVQRNINQTIINQVREMIQEQGKYQPSINREMVGHYEIKTNERGILSINLSNYAYAFPSAHGFTVVKSLTFDVNTGKMYQLSDLFTPGSDYITVISSNISAQIKQRGLPLVNPFTAISSNQDQIQSIPHAHLQASHNRCFPRITVHFRV